MKVVKIGLVGQVQIGVLLYKQEARKSYYNKVIKNNRGLLVYCKTAELFIRKSLYIFDKGNCCFIDFSIVSNIMLWITKQNHFIQGGWMGVGPTKCQQMGVVPIREGYLLKFLSIIYSIFQ